MPSLPRHLPMQRKPNMTQLAGAAIINHRCVHLTDPAIFLHKQKNNSESSASRDSYLLHRFFSPSSTRKNYALFYRQSLNSTKRALSKVLPHKAFGTRKGGTWTSSQQGWTALSTLLVTVFLGYPINRLLAHRDILFNPLSLCCQANKIIPPG